MSEPERIEFLSAVLLTSADPGRQADFYRTVLGLPLVEERHDDTAPHWGCELGDVHFAIHGGEIAPAPGPIRIAFWVFDLPQFARHLEARGIRGLRPIERLGEGSLVTSIQDPDGNHVELTQMGSAWVDHLSKRRRDGADVLRRRPDA